MYVLWKLLGPKCKSSFLHCLRLREIELRLSALWIRHFMNANVGTSRKSSNVTVLQFQPYQLWVSSLSKVEYLMSWGVMRMYWHRLSGSRALSINSFILIRRLTASYIAYWVIEESHVLELTMNTSNSSKARNGLLMLSHKDSKRQMVEKLFSPPDKDLGSFSAELPLVCHWLAIFLSSTVTYLYETTSDISSQSKHTRSSNCSASWSRMSLPA